MLFYLEICIMGFGIFMASPIGVWIKSRLYSLIMLAIIVAAGVYLYHHITSKFEELDMLKVTTAQQQKTIKDLVEGQAKLKASDDTTAETITALQSSQTEIDNRSKVRVAEVNKKIKDIAAANLTPEQKVVETSKTYILSLQQSYCKIKPQECPNGVFEEAK